MSPAGRGVTLPGRYYVDPSIFAKEQAQIFSREWVYVARAAGVPDAGDVVRRNVAGESILVVRGRDDVLRAFLNVCRHRGSQLCLVNTANVRNTIRCPYHSWSYGLDGGLLAAPNWEWMSDEEKSGFSLDEVALETWNGLIWVNLADDPTGLADHLDPQLDYRFGGDAIRIGKYGLDELVVGASKTYEVEANWKIIQENFQECYHCSTIHPELIEQIPVFASPDALGTDGYFTDGYRFAESRPGFSLSGRAALPTLPGLGSDELGKYFGMVLRPNCFVSLLPDHAIVHRFEAVSASSSRVVCDWLFAADVAAAPDFDPIDSVEIFHRVNLQDFAAAQWCQPNMASRAYREGGCLVPTEAEIIGNWYYPWYRERIGES